MTVFLAPVWHTYCLCMRVAYKSIIILLTSKTQPGLGSCLIEHFTTIWDRKWRKPHPINTSGRSLGRLKVIRIWPGLQRKQSYSCIKYNGIFIDPVRFVEIVRGRFGGVTDLSILKSLWSWLLVFFSFFFRLLTLGIPEK